MKNLKLKTHLLSVFAVVFFLFLAFGSDDTDTSSTDLNASISFTGTQFVIKNNDSFDYNNAKLEINGKYALNGYNLTAGETYTVGMLQFADDDGNRFNMMIKPQKFTISCDVEGGKHGFCYAEWK